MVDRQKKEESTLEWASRLGKSTDGEGPKVSDTNSNLPADEEQHEGERTTLSMTANTIRPGDILVLEDQPFVNREKESNDSWYQTSSHDRLISLRPKETADKPATTRKYTPFEDEEELLAPTPSTTAPRQMSTKAVPATEASLTFREPGSGRERGRNLRRTLAAFTEAPQSGEASTTTSTTATMTDGAMATDDLSEDLQLTLKRPRIHNRIAHSSQMPRRWDSFERTDSAAPTTVITEQIEEPIASGTQFISDATELATVLGQSTSMMMVTTVAEPARDPIVSGGTDGPSISPNRQSKQEASDALISTGGESLAPLVPMVTDTVNTPTVLSVPDKDMFTIEREPLVRRGVAATLEFLARLGIRPQLCSETLPPQQRPPPKRFDHLRLEHRDEEGNLLTAKEAYKFLSHRFHGKGPGKGKQERLARKRVEEQRRIAAPLTDTPLGIGASLRDRQRATGSTHIVLAEGAHAAPIDSNPMTPAEVSGGGHAIGGVQRTKRQSVRQPQASPIVKKLPKVFGMK